MPRTCPTPDDPHTAHLTPWWKIVQHLPRRLRVLLETRRCLQGAAL